MASQGSVRSEAETARQTQQITRLPHLSLSLSLSACVRACVCVGMVGVFLTPTGESKSKREKKKQQKKEEKKVREREGALTAIVGRHHRNHHRGGLARCR